MNFAYETVAKEDLEMIYEGKALRIRCKNDKNFGILSYNDGDAQTYEAHEIIFKTPGEH